MPHASRLPRLMLTNCLDVSHTTWSRGTPYAQLQATATNNLGNADQLSVLNRGRSWPESTPANNCHRVGAAFGRTGWLGNGWNRVTPW
jgi:hypothetical protein